MAHSPNLDPGDRESWIGRGNHALQRGIGVGGVALIGLTCIGLGYTGLLPLSQWTGAWKGEVPLGMLAVALVFCLVHAYTYAVIGAAAPYSGADYILSSRVFFGPIPFLSSWVFVASSGLAAGSMIASIPKILLPNFLAAAQPLLPDVNLEGVITILSQPQIQILVGTVIVVLAFVSLLATQRAFMRLLVVGLLLAVAAWGVMFLAVGSGSPDRLQAAWDQTLGAGAFDKVISTAQNLGFSASPMPYGPALSGLLVALWIFFGYQSATFFAGDVKKPEHNLIRGSWLALIVAWAVLAGATFLLSRIAAPDWLAAQTFLSQQPGFNAMNLPGISYFALLLQPNLPMLILLLVAWGTTLVNLVQVYIFYTSRILLAWADDGLLPAGMSYVHPRYRSPVVTMLLAAVLVQFGLVQNLLGVVTQAQSNFIYFAIMTMLVPVTAITFFPFLKKSWFEACPAFVRASLGPLPLISLGGIFTLACLIGLLAAPVLYPGGPAPDGLEGLVTFGILVGLGLLWYWGRRLNLRTRGIKVEEIFKQIPHPF